MFLFFLGPVVVHSQDVRFPVHSTGTLRFDVDALQYAGTDGFTCLDIVYAIYLGYDDLTQADTLRSTDLDICIQLTDSAGNVLSRIGDHKTVSLFDSLGNLENTTFIDLKRFQIRKGRIQLDLKVRDTGFHKEGELSQTIYVRHFDDALSLSDLYFVSHVQRSSRPNVFEKQGVLLVPIPSRTYVITDSQQKTFIYYEINHLLTDSLSAATYDAGYTVHDLHGNEIASGMRKRIPTTSYNTSRIEVIPLKDFTTGVYRLNVSVTDGLSGNTQTAAGLFQVISGQPEQEDFLPMSAEDINKYLDQIKYIATAEEKKIFKQLSPRGKQEFLFQFWRSRDPDPYTEENEFLIEHFRRLAVVENQFKGGIDSDMGRVYIQYGPPLDIQREYPSIGYSKSVEIWSYAIDGRVEFVFVDRTMDGKFVLVHSTHKDEYHDQGWREDLK